MKVISFLFILVSCIYISDAQQTQPACRSIATRPEVRSMTASQWASTKTTITRMRDAGWFAWFGKVHSDNFSRIHGNSMFFPFHRRFVQDFERVGRTFNSGFVVPYWDSARDYASPQNSVVLTNTWVGGNGVSGSHCVTGGIQGGWQLTYPNNHCLRRQYNNGNTIKSWYSPEFVASRLSSDNTIAKLRPDIEYSIHGAVHLGLGGDMSTPSSPNDFVFFMHHANLDRLWWQWQNMGSRIWTMDGPGPNGISNLSISNAITYYNDPIRNVMQLGYGNMCFTYGNSVSTPATLKAAKSAGVSSAGASSFDSSLQQPSDAAATDNVSNNLSPQLLSQFFPGTTPNSLGRRSIARRSVAKSSRKVMPLPTIMTPTYAKMHNYNYTDVQAHYRDACGFVNALNSYGYRPLYV